MRRKIITFLMLITLPLVVFAQQANRIVLSVAPNAKSVGLTFRLVNAADKLSVDFGEGEGVKEYANSTSPTTLARLSYTFKTVSTVERQVIIPTDRLLTLRITFSNAINGITEIAAPEMTNFNCDFTNISAHSVVDFSACPKLENLTLMSSGVSEVNLPRTNTLKVVQISPASAPTEYLKKINLEAAPKLEELTMTQAMIDTIDLTAHTSLRKLNVSIGKTPLRAILGAKDLTKLTDFNAKGNALAFDQLPDMNTDMQLDKYQYTDQKTYLISPSRIKGLSIDLASLRVSKGVSPTDMVTLFSWEKKEGDIFSAIPANKVKEVNGVFTFDPSLLVDDMLRVRLTMTNLGFPGIGLKGSNDLISAVVELTPLPVTELVVNAENVGDVAREIGDNAGLLSLTVSGPISKADFEAIVLNKDLKMLNLKDARIVGMDGNSHYADNQFPAGIDLCKKLNVIKFPSTMETMERLCLAELLPNPDLSLYFYTARPPMAIMPFSPDLMFSPNVKLYVAKTLKATYETDGLFSAFAQIIETEDAPTGASPLNDNPETNTLVIESKAAGDIARLLNGRFDLVNLTVSGPANATDLHAIDLNRRLRTLDMTKLEIQADQYNEVAYAENTLPNFLEYAYLSKIYLPTKLTELNAFAIGNSVKMTDVYTLSTVPPKDNGAFASITPERATLHVAKGAGDAYRAAALWKNFLNIVEDADVSVSPVTDTQPMRVVVQPNGLLVSVDAPQLIRIYASDGRLVWQSQVSVSAFVTLQAGIYIVSNTAAVSILIMVPNR